MQMIIGINKVFFDIIYCYKLYLKIERNFPTPFYVFIPICLFVEKCLVEYTFNKENVYFLHTKVEHIKGDKTSNGRRKICY